MIASIVDARGMIHGELLLTRIGGRWMQWIFLRDQGRVTCRAAGYRTLVEYEGGAWGRDDQRRPTLESALVDLLPDQGSEVADDAWEIWSGGQWHDMAVAHLRGEE